MELNKSGPWVDSCGTLIHSVLVAATLLSLIGPWAFERVNVPAEYDCSKPYVRLEGDYCGLPVAGFKIIVLVFGVILEMPARLHVGGASLSEAFRAVLVFCLAALALLPVLLELVSVLAYRGEKLKSVLAPVWALGVSLTVLYGSAFRATYLVQWGLWLYVVTGLIALTMESPSFFRRVRA